MTVKDVRTTARDDAADALDDAQQDLRNADAGATTANTAFAAATDALALLQSTAVTIRAGIASATMPAEQHQLELDLEANMLAQQGARSALSEAGDIATEATFVRQRAVAALEAWRAALAAADAALAGAVAAEKEADAWRAVLDDQQLGDAVATANAAATTTLVSDAFDALEQWLGAPELLELARSRYADGTSAADELVAAVDRATKARDAVLQAQQATMGDVAVAATAHETARDAARWAAELALPQFAWATGALQGIVAGAGAPTPAEQTRIDARAQDATPDPADHEKDVHDANVALRQAEAAFELSALLAEAADPTFDRNTDPSLTAERDAIPPARAAQQAAQGAFTAADRTAVDNWEVALPGPLLVSLVDALRAESIVKRVRALVPTGANSIREDLDDTDDALGDAIKSADDESARTRAADARIAEAGDRLAAAAMVGDQRLLAAVRGDD